MYVTCQQLNEVHVRARRLSLDGLTDLIFEQDGHRLSFLDDEIAIRHLLARALHAVDDPEDED